MEILGTEIAREGVHRRQPSLHLGKSDDPRTLCSISVVCPICMCVWALPSDAHPHWSKGQPYRSCRTCPPRMLGDDLLKVHRTRCQVDHVHRHRHHTANLRIQLKSCRQGMRRHRKHNLHQMSIISAYLALLHSSMPILRASCGAVAAMSHHDTAGSNFPYSGDTPSYWQASSSIHSEICSTMLCRLLPCPPWPFCAYDSPCLQMGETTHEQPDGDGASVCDGAYCILQDTMLQIVVHEIYVCTSYLLYFHTWARQISWSYCRSDGQGLTSQAPLQSRRR
jgi:hypothetical protein